MEHQFAEFIEDVLDFRDRIDIIKMTNSVNKFLISLEDPKVLEYLFKDEFKYILVYDLPKSNKKLLRNLLRITYNTIQFDCCFY